MFVAIDKNIPPAQAQQARKILNTCVHCGMCNATCPTYLVTQNELDGPRGRIYQMLDFYQSNTFDATTLAHLDACLSCGNCITTCPADVQYLDLLEITKPLLEKHAKRGISYNIKKWMLLSFFSSPQFNVVFFKALRNIAPQLLVPTKYKALLRRPPRRSQQRIDNSKANTISPATTIFLHQGCVQKGATPEVNAAARAVLEHCGYTVTTASNEQCCGAMALHLGDEQRAKQQLQHNVRLANQQHAAVITNASSACSLMMKQKIAVDNWHSANNSDSLGIDSVEISDLIFPYINIFPKVQRQRIAFHPPCTLQHGHIKREQIETLLACLGYTLLPIRNDHLCCGSAGTYSIFQPELANTIGDKKIETLEELHADLIVTANIGCQIFLGQKTNHKVYHWLELLETCIAGYQTADDN